MLVWLLQLHVAAITLKLPILSMSHLFVSIVKNIIHTQIHRIYNFNENPHSVYISGYIHTYVHSLRELCTWSRHMQLIILLAHESAFAHIHPYTYIHTYEILREFNQLFHKLSYHQYDVSGQLVIRLLFFHTSNRQISRFNAQQDDNCQIFVRNIPVSFKKKMVSNTNFSISKTKPYLDQYVVNLLIYANILIYRYIHQNDCYKNV